MTRHTNRATAYYIRRKIDKIYARLRNRVNSYVDDETENPALAAFITQVNTLSKRFNTIAAKHHRKSGKKHEGGTDEGAEGADGTESGE